MQSTEKSITIEQQHSTQENSLSEIEVTTANPSNDQDLKVGEALANSDDELVGASHRSYHDHSRNYDRSPSETNQRHQNRNANRSGNNNKNERNTSSSSNSESSAESESRNHNDGSSQILININNNSNSRASDSENENASSDTDTNRYVNWCGIEHIHERQIIAPMIIFHSFSPFFEAVVQMRNQTIEVIRNRIMTPIHNRMPVEIPMEVVVLIISQTIATIQNRTGVHDNFITTFSIFYFHLCLLND